MNRTLTAAGTREARLHHVRWRVHRTALSTALLGAALLAVDLTAPFSAAQLPTATTTPRATAATTAQAGPCVAGWSEQPIPGEAFISTPFEILTHDENPAWILGGANSGVLALRWDGSTWVRSATSTRGHQGLVGGDAIGAREVLAVGYKRPTRGEGDGSLLPISGQITGATWKGRTVPVPPGPRATLTDVASVNRKVAWAVGTRLEDGRLRAWAARWNGSRWSRREPAPGTGSGLLAVDRAPSGAVWAVGWREGQPGQPRPFIVRDIRGRWRSVKPATLPKGTAVLTDVEFRSGRDGWAVGYLAAKGSDRHIAMLMRWNGKRWSRQPLPWAQDVAALPRSISTGRRGQLWIAGTQPANEQREARGFIAHFDGSAWDVDVLGVPDDVRSEVMAVAATREGAVATANVGASLLVLHTCVPSATPAAAARERSKIKVSRMKARRKARVEEDHPVRFDGEMVEAAAAGFAPAGKVAALPAPIAPQGFTVRDVAGESGLAQWTLTYDGFAADLDGNGYRDVFFSRHGNQRPRLAMNGPAGFSDAPGDAFSIVDRHGCDSADADRDGNPDILCAVGAARGKSVQRHELSLAPDKGARRLSIGALGISDPLGRGRNVGFIRLDGDAYPEVFIGNAPDRDDGLPSYNRFYRNSNGTFVPAPGVGLDSSHGAGCIVVSDVDHDDDEDLAYCTAYGFKGRKAGLRLMRNEGGRLKDRTVELGLQPIGDIDVAFADVSGDGRRDVIQLGRDLLRVSKWTGRGYRKVYEARVPDAVALAAGDASGDGIADLYIVRGNDSRNHPDRLLVSRDAGRDFVPVDIPQTKKGSADDVIALDFDQNGHTDFVVLNGRKKAGPVQLLAAFPA